MVRVTLTREELDRLTEEQRLHDKEYYTYSEIMTPHDAYWPSDGVKRELKRRRALEAKEPTNATNRS